MSTALDGFRQKIEHVLAFDQPALSVSVVGDQVMVAGDYFLNDEGSAPAPEGPMATFAVRVLFDAAYPSVEPLVYETGGAIPQGRHLNPNNTCCLGVWEQWLVEEADHSVSAFFAGPFRDYFLSQTHYRLHGEWPFGELPHGLDGIVVAYASVLGIEPDKKKVVEHLRVFSRPGWPRGHWPCPCGSGRCIRACHRVELANLRTAFAPHMAKRMLERIASPY